jgi:hypothetical protein
MWSMTWDANCLKADASAVSVSRRSDIPGLYAEWFENRLQEGFADYIPAGPTRRIRRSLRPDDVTHFNFWSKWPRPFFRVLDRVLDMGYPVLWNVTITGLGQTNVEPNVPPADKVVACVRELSEVLSPAAILWRYDPIFLSQEYSEAFHVENFRRLAARLAGHVDRVAVSFVERYGRRVKPDLELYESETGDHCLQPSLEQKANLIDRLREIAAGEEMTLTLCCSPDVRQATGCPASGCNSFPWARRVYPALQTFPGLRNKPTRADCACTQETDIGVYDTCIYGCRFSYGSCNYRRALQNFRRHDPAAPCLIP